MFVIAAENERLLALNKGKSLPPAISGSSRRLVTLQGVGQVQPLPGNSAPVPQQTFSRSPDPSLKYIVNTSPYKAPVIIKQS